jgi:hypothetical protein
MKHRRAFVSGVAGGLMMTILMALGRWFGIPLSFEAILGTMIGLRPGVTAWFVGLAIHLVLAGLIGLAYGWVFERMGVANRVVGAPLGLAHGAVVGVLLGLLPMIHPLVPGTLPDLGFFMSRLGAYGVVALFGLHFAYGTVVGFWYGDAPAVLEPLSDRERERREVA